MCFPQKFFKNIQNIAVLRHNIVPKTWTTKEKIGKLDYIKIKNLKILIVLI